MNSSPASTPPFPAPAGSAPAQAAQALAALLAGAARHALRRPGGSRSKDAEAGLMLNSGRNDGPPDLDELWRDFNRKLSGLFGGRRGRGDPGNGGPNFQPDMRSAGLGAGLIGGVVALIWLASGFFIVQEGEQAVVLTFGKYSKTVDAGFNWRYPFPFQEHRTVQVTQTRSVEVGRNTVVPATGLRDSSMITQDENIVDIRFNVQWRLKDAKDYLFENRGTDSAVVQAAESAVREIVGRSNMDSVLYEQRDAIAIDLVKSIQAQLDRLKAGVLITNVNVQSVQPPEQVQAAFDDAFKAGADRERLKNEGQAYANDIIPKARGTAARLREEAEGYKARVVATAEGDADRFRRVLAEYEKAPAVTRDRLYIDAMTQVYANVSKVMVESRSGSNLMYLPLDKLLQQSSTTTVVPSAPAAAPPGDTVTGSSGGSDARSRDSQRSRDRDIR
jgi:membrane protease subunit HflK